MTRKEFIQAEKNYQKGMIQAYQHIEGLVRSCIKAQREGLTKKNLEELADMNPHLWKK